MAIKKVNSDWCPLQEETRYHFVMDSADDVADLPKCCPGSTAMVADSTCKVYMVNASGEWRELA